VAGLGNETSILAEYEGPMLNSHIYLHSVVWA